MEKPISINGFEISGTWVTKDTSISIDNGQPNGRHGMFLLRDAFTNGEVSCLVKFNTADTSLVAGEISNGAMLMLRFHGQNSDYLGVGIGINYHYVGIYKCQRFKADTLLSVGSSQQVKPNVDYKLTITLESNHLVVYVNDTRVLEHNIVELDRKGNQLGFVVFTSNNRENDQAKPDQANSETAKPEQVKQDIRSGINSFTFSNLVISNKQQKIFFIMKFGEPFDSLYKSILVPVCLENKYEAVRVDNIPGPGSIIDDIIDSIKSASIVIADLTTPNPNVYYELGYSHALNIPVIIIAQRSTELPFDIRGLRCIFYDDSMVGKAQFESNLKNAMKSILN